MCIVILHGNQMSEANICVAYFLTPWLVESLHMLMWLEASSIAGNTSVVHYII